MGAWLGGWLAVGCALTLASTAQASDTSEREPLMRRQHGFLFGVGALPLEPVADYLAIGGGYSWQPLYWLGFRSRSRYLIAINTGVERELLERWSVEETDQPRLLWMVGGEAQLWPLWADAQWMGSERLGLGLALTLGGGGLGYEGEVLRPYGSFGSSIRVQVSPLIGLNADVTVIIARDLVRGVNPMLQLELGVSFSPPWADIRPEDRRSGSREVH